MISCSKEDSEPMSREIMFTITARSNAYNSLSLKDWDCKPYDADYIQVELNGNDYFLNIFRIDDILYSESLRPLFLNSSDSIACTIGKFLLWNEGEYKESDLPGTDDTIVMGTPDKLSNYSEFVSHTVSYTFMLPMVDRFTIPMDVLCVGNIK